jgi:hypothetical protein
MARAITRINEYHALANRLKGRARLFNEERRVDFED